MKLADFPAVEALLAQDKLRLVDELWASLARDLESLDVTEEEKRLLDERWANFERNPGSALSLEELKAKLAAAR